MFIGSLYYFLQLYDSTITSKKKKVFVLFCFKVEEEKKVEEEIETEKEVSHILMSPSPSTVFPRSNRCGYFLTYPSRDNL